ncbi:MAG: Ig-like domain-containing protein, partial [Rhodospirillales bacterium]|nr:Ig-like domain-containing protein [Rhodospirillales bacterium]
GNDRVVSEDGSGVTIDANFGAGNSIEEIDAGGGSVSGDSSNQTMDFSGTTLTDVSEIDGAGGHDTITGTSEDDVIRGGTGNDKLDGGEGDDTAVFSGNLADYEITVNSNGSLTVKDLVGSDGKDTITNIEKLQFADQTIITEEFINEAPEANDLVGSMGEDDLSVTISTVGQFSDADSDNLTVTVDTGESGWTAVVNNGEIVFTPPAENDLNSLGDQESQDFAFNYTVSDGVESVTKDVTVTVTGSNDAPVVTATDEITVGHGDSQVIEVSSTDAEGDDVLYTLEDGPDNGTLTLDGVEQAVGAVFTQEEIDSGALQYTADDLEENSAWDASTPEWMVSSGRVDGERGTESGVKDFGGGRSLSSWDGIGLTAFSLGQSYMDENGVLNLDNADAGVTFSNSRGLGVNGDLGNGKGTQASYQINHAAEGSSNQNAGESEALALDLGQEVSSAQVTIASMFRNEHGGEKGRWEAFDAAGNKVGEGVLNEETVDYKNSHEGVVNITLDENDAFAGDSFQHIVFTATEYSDDTTVTHDSSDITIKSVQFDSGEQSALEKNLEAPENATSVDVTFEGTHAGYDNVLGMYKIDDAGNMSDFEVIWDSVKDEGVEAGETTSRVGLEGGEDVGFFLIANEGDWFTDNYDASTMSLSMNADNSISLTDNDVQEGEADHSTTFGGNKVFTTSSAGTDNVMDVASGIGEDGALWIGFEDQVNGDKDFNDVMISLNFNVDNAETDSFTLSVTDQNATSDGYSTENDPEVTFNINIDNIT